ncbi:MAG: endopeptidase La [Barnesiella sp.]|nr:endopeptidase La [Barnesiella sp.]
MNFNEDNDRGQLLSIGPIDLGEAKMRELEVDLKDVPILPTRNVVLFPHVTIPIKLGRETSMRIAEIAKKREIAIGIVCQLDSTEDEPALNALCHYGVLGEVLQIIQLPDNTSTAIVRGTRKFKILGRGAGATMPEAPLSAEVKFINETSVRGTDKEFDAVCDDIKSTAMKLASAASENPIEADFIFNMTNNSAAREELINLTATHVPVDIKAKMSMLAMFRIKERAVALLSELVKQEEMVNIAKMVHQRARDSFDDQQRRVFLQRQMEAIDQELNGEENDADNFKAKAASMDIPEKAAAHFNKEVEKLMRLNPQSPDYSVQYAYLETFLELPWGINSELNSDFAKAEEELDSCHYGLEKVKERILEQIAVLMHNPDGKSPILCLVGPPGVGKTSLGQSIADALGRKFQRISLGGLHDEAEIRGHRRTYIGAMPGRIIEAMRRAGTSNPVLMLDEIDKIGNDYKGDPAAALLEVLDPEQNYRFHDNYVDVDFDLSKVLFIATANTLETVQRPLIDRMEVIDLSGYILEEKIAIARDYLLPRLRREYNIADEALQISDDALALIVESYTAESGVRQLEKALASVARKVVYRTVGKKPVKMPVGKDDVKDYLGIEKYSKDRYEGNSFPGVVTGLAWTAVGGEILFIETSLSRGKGEKLTLTGNLGDVMKESAMIALQFVKSHAEQLGIPHERFEKTELHIHVPEGAIPKDGPSAGITMATSIASAFTGRRVAERLAMTGEITLRGKVLPVGGIKEKILAAKRAGITDIILSSANRKDIDDIPAKYLDGLTFHYVDTVTEVLDIALI